MYNLKAIQIFVVVAETCSFRKAAEVLHRSQSAVSTQIKLLEEQIGVSLFHRTTRRVQLTAEGEQLLGHAQRAVAALDQGLRQIREAANIQCGHIAMGCVPSIAATVLPKVLAEFQRKRSTIRLELRELASAQLLAAVAQQEISFGIGPEVDEASDFDFSPITTEPIYAAPARAASLAGFPPTFIATGAIDLFVDEDIGFAQALIRAGVPTELHVYPGAYHGFTLIAASAVAQRFERDSLEALRRALA